MQPDLLINAAKGWHSIQLAVLGFLGLCGVMRVGEAPSGPEWLELWSTGMAILSFVTALLSMWMVGGVAFPLYTGDHMPTNAAGRLKTGIGMTFVAVIMTVLSALDGWWPGESPGLVEVRDAAGNRVCGTVVEGRVGWITVDAKEGARSIAVSSVAMIRPVSSCP